MEKSAIRLWKFVNKIVQRYDELNLKIHSLRLWVHGSNDSVLVNKLIVKAMKMGASSLDLKFHRDFALPNEVFLSENLTTLSVSGCKICIGSDGEVSCSKLKSLTLNSVSVELGDMMWKMIPSCPLIENLSVSIYPKFGKSDLGSVVDGFQNLKCLTLDSCYTDDVIEISSSSLECINLCHDKIVRAKFDVPNIRKFTISSSSIPLVSFETTICTWESHISIKRRSTPSDAWFLRLNKLLKRLSLSKVSLFLKIFSEKNIGCSEKIQVLTKPEVENLTINGPCSVDPGFFYYLFQCCRPIYITQHLSPTITNDFVESYYKRMMHQISLNSCFAYQKMSTLCNIEEVSMEFYDESLSAWRPRLLDTSTSPGVDKQRIRLHLRWGH